MANRDELAVTYAALLLHDEGLEITADQLNKVIAAANVEVAPFWVKLFAKFLEGRNLGDLISNVGAAAPAAAAPVAAAGGAAAAAEAAAPEPESESEEEEGDFGFSLFD